MATYIHPNIHSCIHEYMQAYINTHTHTHTLTSRMSCMLVCNAMQYGALQHHLTYIMQGLCVCVYSYYLLCVCIQNMLCEWKHSVACMPWKVEKVWDKLCCAAASTVATMKLDTVNYGNNHVCSIPLVLTLKPLLALPLATDCRSALFRAAFFIGRECRNHSKTMCQPSP